MLNDPSVVTVGVPVVADAESRVLRITTPEPPLPALPLPADPEAPPPPPPVFTSASLAAFWVDPP